MWNMHGVGGGSCALLVTVDAGAWRSGGGRPLVEGEGDLFADTFQRRERHSLHLAQKCHPDCC